MKKLLIAAAIVCAAAMSQAATANWKFNASNIYNGKGTTAAKVASGTAVLVFDAGVLSQSALFTEFAKDTSADLTELDGYVTGGAIGSTAGVVPVTNFSYGEQSIAANPDEGIEEQINTYNFYLAIVDGDNIYLSKSKEVTANQSATVATVGFGSQAPTDGPTSKSLPTTGFSAAGQWAAAPEPTSGLLMLLGMAGLALRRRRA